MSTTAPPMNPNAVTLSGAIMVSSVIVIFFLFVFFLILYLRSNIHFITTDFTHEIPPPNFSRGLQPAVLKSLPVRVFSAGDFRDGIECAICISEIADGEMFRFLPGCRHGFHLECIDMWFSSNSTCPVCRRLVELAKNLILNNEDGRCSVKNGSLNVDCSGEGGSMEISGFSLQWSKRSLLLAEGSKGVSSGCCSRGWDVEQGMPIEVARIDVEGHESSSS